MSDVLDPTVPLDTPLELRDGSVVLDPRLDALVQFDENSRQWDAKDSPFLTSLPGPAASTNPQATPVFDMHWGTWFYLDQLAEGACVGFTWTHELLGDPSPIPGIADPAYALDVYWKAQEIDPWPETTKGGEGGTSVLAGAKIVQASGNIINYRWAFNTADALSCLMYGGPVVIGVNWYRGMFTPDANGVIAPTGELLGRHCTLLKGLRTNGATNMDQLLLRGQVLGHNSWGKKWGPMGGDFLMSVPHLMRLLGERGEVCVPLIRR